MFRYVPVCIWMEMAWVRAHTCLYSLLWCVVIMMPCYPGHLSRKFHSSWSTKLEISISLKAFDQIQTAQVSKGPKARWMLRVGVHCLCPNICCMVLGILKMKRYSSKLPLIPMDCQFISLQKANFLLYNNKICMRLVLFFIVCLIVCYQFACLIILIMLIKGLNCNCHV